MTIARDGLREIAISSIVLGSGAAFSGWAGLTISAWFWPLAVVLAALWLFTILFFRVPSRITPSGSGILVAPADGKVTEITRLPTYDEIGRPAVRIGIFLSVFDVHVNCSPCDATVVKTEHRPGQFLDARHPECGTLNEANMIVMEPSEFRGPIVVRQIAGLIARRIVSHLRVDDVVQRGERFGLIKFGSRTELIVPEDSGLEVAIKVGDSVKGGESILMRPLTSKSIREHGDTSSKTAKDSLQASRS